METNSRTNRNSMMLFIMSCLYTGSYFSSAWTRGIIQMKASGRNVESYVSELKSRPQENFNDGKKTISRALDVKDGAVRSYSCDLKITKPTALDSNSLSCYFEKSSSCSSCKTGICPVDNRPCNANRDYMDHIYGARFMPKPKPVFQAYKYSQQSQMHMYATTTAAPPPVPERILSASERRSRRQKLFLMSTWLEDLLPNPSQGRSWMFNSICDTVKITTRVGRFIISFIMMLTSATTLSSPTEEQNHRDSTTHGADHL
jgi:hypothetical protein